MKKTFLLALLVCALLLPCLNVGATAQLITLDGVTLEIPADMGTIQEKDDRTFVPVRFICEYFGCDVSFNEVQQSATITDKNNTSYLVMDGSNQLFVLPDLAVPTLYNMDTKTFIDQTDERMYVPLRFLAEAMKFTVSWDASTETVSITSAAE
ncbi:MAG: copper amine oxidase N-terminal domain-containing protein [Clostridia bacterium]|nr:copper amine oxidase N-terminal domain-containing protein [Clostridia bacterium]